MVLLPAALVSLTFFGAGETVLLDFYADWCGPCRAMHPTVQALAAEGYPVRKINVDREPALAKQYGVTALPCFVMLVDGREVDRVIGGTSRAKLEQMCRLASPPGRSSGAGASLAAVGPPNAPPYAGSGSVIPTSATLPAEDYATPAVTPQFSDRSASPRGSRNIDDDQLLAVTVRLRIEDPQGHSSGTGTLIDARGGEALILTCGHIFRDSQGQGRIEVDLFGSHASQRIPGRLVAHDLKTDVGLVAIRVPGSVRAARVAPPGYELQRGQSVVSVGCDNGADPSVRRSHINSLNKFLGPANIQVAGQPVEGRSGGGLFSSDGLVIGVCNAADPQDREGLFAAAACIHAILDQTGLAYVYDASRSGPELAAARSDASDPLNQARLTGEPMPRTDEPTPRGSLEEIQWPSTADTIPVRTVAATREDLPPLDRDEQAALGEIRRRLDEGYEVVCIVRPRNDPQAKSEVLVLEQVSPNLLRHLETETRAAERPRFTSSRQ